ncbi:MAG: DUF504 domain-containing protein [Methanobacterium sp.]|jgi:hypothetical protein
MAKNILNMVLWHPRMKINQAKISYIHRGAPGNLKTIKGSFIDRLENGFLILNDGTQIPFHRIIKIEYNDKTLYIR